MSPITVKNLRLRFVDLWLALATLLLTGCSRTVKWEEEVPLNTGETIWVTRHLTYKFDVTAHNPFVPEYIPDVPETLDFSWRGKKYSHSGNKATMVIAISPSTNLPVLFTLKEISGWKPPCAKPYYDQLNYLDDGLPPTLQPAVESWAFDLRRNVMFYRGKPSEMQSRYTSIARSQKDSRITNRVPSLAQIDRNYQPEVCPKKGD